MSNLTVLVFFVTMFVVAQHGLAVRNVTTTDAIETQADGRAEIMNSSQQENIQFPRSARHAHRRHKHAKLTMYMANGFPARKGQFPYLVAVHKKSNMDLIRSGAIISERHVLTTAEAICKARGVSRFAPQDLVVHAGMVNLEAPDLQSYDVEGIMCHAQYFPPEDEIHRLVVIRITKHFLFSAAVKSIQISTRRNHAGLDVTIAGWDSWDFNNHLQYGDFFVLSLEECREMLKDYAIEGLYTTGTGCAHSGTTSEGPYMDGNDNGAPMMHRGQLLGIMAWKYAWSRVAGYVSVPHHIDWIRRQCQQEY